MTTDVHPGPPPRPPFLARFRSAAWLGWQIESNWADALTFIVYSLLRPLGTSLILAGMYWAVAKQSSRPEAFAAFYIGNTFHEYVVRVLIGMGWIVVEEREEYETLKYVFASPVGMLTYLWGRSVTKFALASVSVVLMLAMGWTFLGVRGSWATFQPLSFVLAFVIGLAATLFLGFLVAGWALMLPRAAISMNEGVGVGLYLLCGVIFPIDLLPHGLREISLVLPFTYWYEALRRFLLGHGASQMLSQWSDVQLLGALAITTVGLGFLSAWGYRALEDRARRLGRLEHSTLF
jgi:ABC-2 type transport system permease protein